MLVTVWCSAFADRIGLAAVRGLTVFLISVIGVAIFISSLAANQQQAMMGVMVFMMPAMMLSGFTSPVQNMPDWLYPVAMVDPLTHFLVIVRGVFLRDIRSISSPSGCGRWRPSRSSPSAPQPGCFGAGRAERRGRRRLTSRDGGRASRRRSAQRGRWRPSASIAGHRGDAGAFEKHRAHDDQEVAHRVEQRQALLPHRHVGDRGREA